MKLYKYMLAGTLCGLMLSTAACGSKDVATNDSGEVEQQEVETNTDAGEDTADSGGTNTPATNEQEGSNAPGSLAGGQLSPGTDRSNSDKRNDNANQNDERQSATQYESPSDEWEQKSEEEDVHHSSEENEGFIYLTDNNFYESEMKWECQVAGMMIRLPMSVTELEDMTGSKVEAISTDYVSADSINPGERINAKVSINGTAVDIYLMNKNFERASHEDCTVCGVHASGSSWSSSNAEIRTPFGHTWGDSKDVIEASFLNNGYEKVDIDSDQISVFCEKIDGFYFAGMYVLSWDRDNKLTEFTLEYNCE